MREVDFVQPVLFADNAKGGANYIEYLLFAEHAQLEDRSKLQRQDRSNLFGKNVFS